VPGYNNHRPNGRIARTPESGLSGTKILTGRYYAVMGEAAGSADGFMDAIRIPKIGFTVDISTGFEKLFSIISVKISVPHLRG
jgi:hypothetical protein